MAEPVILQIWHYKEGDNLDFNVLNVPDELLLPLAGYLKNEFQNRISLACAPSFRQERAAFIDKVQAANREKGLHIDTSQMFLDFK